MYKKITKIPDFVFAILTFFIPIALLFIFFSPDFYKKEIIKFGYLFLIAILCFIFSLSISILWIKLKIVSFNFVFYYPVIDFSFVLILLTYNLSTNPGLLALRIILVLASIFLIIPSLIFKEKIKALMIQKSLRPKK